MRWARNDRTSPHAVEPSPEKRYLPKKEQHDETKQLMI